jgi:hypothetical protein
LFVFWLIISCLNSGFIAQQDVSGETEGEGYVLTNGSQLLIKDNPLSLTPFLLAMLDPILIFNTAMAAMSKRLVPK